MAKITFTDRYQALGIPYPDLSTVCTQCEGNGWGPNATRAEIEAAVREDVWNFLSLTWEETDND